MRTNETGAAGNQITQSASLQRLIVVTMVRGAFGDRFSKIVMFLRRFGSFLRAIAIGIRIVPIRIVVVRSSGIHRIQDNAEDVALDADKQVTCAGESLFGSFAAAHDE